MRGRLPPDLGGRCRACFLPIPACICPDIPRLSLPARLLVVQHYKEGFKTTNTGRLAVRAVIGSRLVTWGAPGGGFEPGRIPDPGSWVLFPGADLPRGGPPELLVVLDGTWGQARRMARRVPGVAALPCLSLPDAGQRTRLRRPPRAGAMSTLEAVAAAYRLLGEDEAARALDALYDEFVSRVMRLRGGAPPRPGNASDG